MFKFLTDQIDRKTGYTTWLFYVVWTRVDTFAMVTNHLQAPYGVYFTKNRTILRRPAGGRKNHMIFYRFFRHRTVPGEFKVLLEIPRHLYGVW